jgi:hypothetical protein
MSRLFLSSREIDFINDITKELIKDVVGQKIFYYKVRSDISNIHEIYEESIDKAFNPPIEIEARVDYQPQSNRVDKFGIEDSYSIEVYLHFRDLLDRDIEVKMGDYFLYDATFFEIIKLQNVSNIYGQIEHTMGVKIEGKQARFGQIAKTPHSPSSERFTDENAIQHEFVQQRGFEENILGKTGDRRELIEKGILDVPITGPAEVSPRGDETGTGSSFYDDEV